MALNSKQQIVYDVFKNQVLGKEAPHISEIVFRGWHRLR